MSKVVREDIDNLTATITVVLEKNDYAAQFNSELNKYRKQGQMKGFRKGKTPLSVIKKMYGKAILSDVINQSLQQSLYEYLNEEELPIIGQPIPSEDQEAIDLNAKDLQDYEFKFDIGLAPEFEVQGLDQPFEKLTVEVTDEMVEEDFQAARKRVGERKSVEDNIQENDMVKFSGKEKGKEEGLETEFSILVSNTQEAAKEQILQLKKGDTVTLNLFELEPDKDEDYVRKYLMNLPEEDDREVGAEFECTVEEVNRVLPAEVDQAFFDKAFGEGTVESEEDARNKIREQIERFYDTQGEALLSRDIQDALLDSNTLDLPEGFLKRWMLTSNEGVTMDIVEKEYENFSKNLQWSLIRSKLVKQHEISVEEGEVMDRFRQQIRNYFGGGSAMPGIEQIVDSTAMRMMEDEKQYEQAFEEVMTDKLFKALAEQVGASPKTVSKETFEEEVQKARAASAAASQVVQEEE
jgi:trigger factor